MAQSPTLSADPDRPERLVAGGPWRIDRVGALSDALAAISGSKSELDAREVERMDATGALLLLRAAEQCGIDRERIMLAERHQELFDTVRDASDTGVPETESMAAWKEFLANIGESVTGLAGNLRVLLGFLGLTLSRLIPTLWRPQQWRITSTVHHMEETGFNALPLAALLSFLVGAVVAYLGATVLRDFGAELFVVDLTTYAFFREFGVLITAILLAGRTSSAFAAQIGTMKSREEIDAMRTIGLDPIVLLVLPRLLALLIMLPILGTVATVAGVLGGMLVAVLSLGISPELFFSRLQDTLELRHYLVGLAKAPLFATVIALVGCLEGFKVTGTAQSVGERTTSAVVQSITLVIVIDAIAAVFFMEVGW